MKKNRQNSHLALVIISFIVIFWLWSAFWHNYSAGISSLCETINLCEQKVVHNEINNNQTTPEKEVKKLYKDKNTKSENRISLEKFWKVYKILETKAVEQWKLDDLKHIEDTVIAWLVRSLDDPYSLYMSEKDNKNFKEDLAWNFEWIWAELQMKNELVTVVSPLKDSPAIKAGLRPQDIIFKVDGEDITWWSLTDVVKMIRWPKWEEVVLSIMRAWENGLIEIKIIRDVIHINSVKFELKNWTWEAIWYISINQFWDSTVREYFEALEEAQKADLKWIIIDLRYNWWWYLDWSIVLSSPFLEESSLVTNIKSKNWSEDKLTIKYDTKLKGLPIVILINWWSASASEIVAWALRDHKKAILVWSTSFWKWTVQELISLNWKSSVRVTTAKWFTPNWQNIHKTWITPDVEIPRNYEDISDWEDAQIDKAIEILLNWDFDQFFLEKLSLTWSSILKYNASWTLVTESASWSIIPEKAK